ncbi:adenylate kinase [Helcococcus kunzii]|uniref:Adenylate kinase n=1 Tax=Helcococcus kunzii ATCC 51366 TaxID=883114 RepID=H3NP47_9FIRM|nr:adenylate kinase [Helcococcus kunzii]EHR33509.1 adenylate kinase [Helcococcus kunzii ATCC 51366]MCT1795771.1 adenylate kinase [Helcococcus kunzii]MCT1989350.1 adenylate kinase [Helcococcus kunzii]QZO75720.1 adenylate kinase [Helcococcus kunzii]
MILILLGPPGVGKGSQANKIIDGFGVTHISTGDIFRKNIKEETELGLKVKEIIAAGELVSDDLTNELVFDRLSNETSENGFMLDGYPRNINQAEALDKWLSENGKELTKVIYIDADKDVLISRIAGRRVCKNCGATYHVVNHPPKEEGICDICGGTLIQRPDDNEETAKSRIEIYEEQTSPLVEYYTKSGKLQRFNGNNEIEEVYLEIENSLK